MSIEFNSTQQQVFDNLKEFVEKNDYDTYILNGYAGTGKTFLIQEFAKHLKEKKIKFSLLATTGRAAAVLRGKTDLPTSTIHSALYSFTKVDGDDDTIAADAPVDAYGQMKLVFEPNQTLQENCIYIVDEASMLASESKDVTSFAVFGSGDLLPDLLAAIGKNKIIFVGDTAQLPPVFQEVSPALDLNWLNKFGRKTTTGTLSKIMRTDKDNDILKIAEEVRMSIGKTTTTKYIKLPAANRKNCTVLPDSNTVFLEHYTHFLQFGPDKTIGIAPSNRLCNHLNMHFRKRLFKNSEELIVPGEILMVTQNNYIIPLTNGDFVKVLEVVPKSIRAGINFQNIRLLHLVTKKEYEIKIALNPFLSHSPNLTPDQQRNLMIDFSISLKKKGIMPNSEQYKEALRKDSFLNSLRATYGYVVTCHKAQGGEWENVFLFLDSKMYGYMSQDSMRRWWYTAITRTKEQLFLHKEWWII